MVPFSQILRCAGESVREHRLLSRRERRQSRQRWRTYLRLAVEQLEPRWLLSNIPVTTELDIVNAGDGLTSLREAVIQANGRAGFDTITFASSMANKPVVLLNGQLTITETLTIRGLGAGLTTVTPACRSSTTS